MAAPNDVRISANSWFYARWAVTILVVTVFLTPIAFFFARRAVRNNSNRFEDWLPTHLPETAELEWFRHHFSGNRFVLVSWDGCTLGVSPDPWDDSPDDPRIERLARLLVPSQSSGTGEPGATPEAPTVVTSATPELTQKCRFYFESVTTARRLIRQLTSPPLNLTENEARRRLGGLLIGPDGLQTCVLLSLSPESVSDFGGAVGRGGIANRVQLARRGALFEALEVCGIDAQEVRVGGPPVHNLAIDEEGARTLGRLSGLSAISGLALAWFSLRSVRMTAIVFACGALSGVWSMAAVGLCGQSSDAVLFSMPALIYVLGISGAVHLVNYYRDAIDQAVANPVGDAVRHGWKPALLCSTTTALGLLSLCTSELLPIRKYAIFSAVGVMQLLLILFLFLPAALITWCPRPQRFARSYPNGGESPGPSRASSNRLARAVASWITRHHALVSVLCLLVIGFLAWGLVYTDSSVDLMRLFDPQARVVRDYDWLERRLGNLVPLEVVLRFDPSTIRLADEAERENAWRLSLVDRLEVVLTVQQAIVRRFGRTGEDLVGNPLSPATFAPGLRDASSRTFAKRASLNQRLQDSQSQLEASGLLRVDPHDGSELWRISLRLASFRDVDYGQLTAELRETVEPIIAARHAAMQIQRGLVAIQQRHPDRSPRLFLWTSSGPTEQGTAAAPGILLLRLQAWLRTLRIEFDRLPDPIAASPLSHLDEIPENALLVAYGANLQRDVAKLNRASVPTLFVEDRHDTSPLSREYVTGIDHLPWPGPPLAAVFTGVVPIVHKAQRALLDSLVDSTFWSFVTITPLLMLVSRSVSAGAVAMIPNILPILMVFGGMGWLRYPIDIGSMMSASIALGVAVDDTIHFLTWFREELRSSPDRETAILNAYERCAAPTIQAGLVNGVGLSVFALSTFTPTKQFGFLMLTIVLAGVVAELIMLPALLAGPAGRYFTRNVSDA